MSDDASPKIEPVLIDGSFGVGGGQLLRTCLMLSALTGRGFDIVGYHREMPSHRVNKQPGTLIQAVGSLCGAHNTALPRTGDISFRPLDSVVPGPNGQSRAGRPG